MPGRAPGAARPPASPAALPAGEKADTYALVGTALALRGVPYRNGGGDRTGFDCSGFTQYVFAQHGFALPRAVRDQFTLGKTIKAGELSPGDLIFFTTNASGASHVAIAVGGDEFVHAPSSAGVVRVERLSSSYWGPRVLGIRRVTAN
jgi:cell wall-associated NlpC family hydrolase